jgi:hypothetical protein
MDCALSEELSLEELTLPEVAPPEFATLRGDALAKRWNPQQGAAAPCFFSRVCQQRAAVEKSGRSVCRECADTRLQGTEYPLRGAAAEPLYLTGRAASEALDMVENMPLRARRRLRGGIWS